MSRARSILEAATKSLVPITAEQAVKLPVDRNPFTGRIRSKPGAGTKISREEVDRYLKMVAGKK